MSQNQPLRSAYGRNVCNTFSSQRPCHYCGDSNTSTCCLHTAGSAQPINHNNGDPVLRQSKRPRRTATASISTGTRSGHTGEASFGITPALTAAPYMTGALSEQWGTNEHLNYGNLGGNNAGRSTQFMTRTPNNSTFLAPNGWGVNAVGNRHHTRGAPRQGMGRLDANTLMEVDTMATMTNDTLSEGSSRSYNLLGMTSFATSGPGPPSPMGAQQSHLVSNPGQWPSMWDTGNGMGMEYFGVTASYQPATPNPPTYQNDSTETIPEGFNDLDFSLAAELFPVNGNYSFQNIRPEPPPANVDEWVAGGPWAEDVAQAYSPFPASPNLPVDRWNLVNINAEIPSLQEAPPAKTRPPPNYADAKLRFENAVPSSSGMRLITEDPQPATPRTKKRGGRTGRLSIATKRKAAIVRAGRACWNCRIMKTSCNTDNKICPPCQKKMGPPTLPANICVKQTLVDIGNLLFSPLIATEFSTATLKAMTTTHIKSFTGNAIMINVSMGPDYPLMKFKTSEFVPEDLQLLEAEYYEIDEGRELKSYAPPIGIPEEELAGVPEILEQHIEDMLLLPSRNEGEHYYGATSIVSWTAYEIINKYRIASQENGGNPILDAACKLHTMQSSLSVISTLTAESANFALTQLNMPTRFTCAPIIISTLIDLQIKSEMFNLLVNTTRELLRDLDDLLLRPAGDKTIRNWIDCFCATVVICIFVEAFQIKGDAISMKALRRGEAIDCERSQLYTILERQLWHRLRDLFHLVFTLKKVKKRMNPIKNGLRLGEREGVTQEMVSLVEDFRRLVEEHNHDMKSKVKEPEFNKDPDVFRDHLLFREENSARLLSDFILSFNNY